MWTPFCGRVASALTRHNFLPVKCDRRALSLLVGAGWDDGSRKVKTWRPETSHLHNEHTTPQKKLAYQSARALSQLLTCTCALLCKTPRPSHWLGRNKAGYPPLPRENSKRQYWVATPPVLVDGKLLLARMEYLVPPPWLPTLSRNGLGLLQNVGCHSQSFTFHFALSTPYLILGKSHS